MALPRGNTAPTTVNRHLLPHEQQVITVRFHPAVLAGPAGAAASGLAAAVVLSLVADLSGDAQLIMWVTWALLALYALAKAISWPMNYFVVTTQRMLIIKGTFTRDVTMTPLSWAVNFKLRRTTTGRLMGYGHFILVHRHQDPAMRMVRFLPYPEQLYLEVCGLIYPGRSEAESD